MKPRNLTVTQQEEVERRERRRDVALMTALAVATLWVMACAVAQGRLAAAFVVCAAVVALVLLRIILPILASAPGTAFAAVALLCFIVTEMWSGPRWDADSLALVLSATVAILVATFLLVTRRVERFPSVTAVVLAGLFAWSSISVIDHLGDAPPAPDVRAPVEGDDWTRRTRVGVSLSGGGYRAALIHAGALKALDSLGVPVHNVATVSGGSIIGAFYASGGAPDAFVAHVREKRLSLRRELLHIENVVRLPFPAELPFLRVRALPFFEFSRSDVQRGLLDAVLFKRSHLHEVRERHGPNLMVCATDLSRGALVGIVDKGVLVAYIDAERGRRSVNHEVWPIPNERAWPSSASVAEIVTASGAFPLAFAPTHVTMQTVTSHGIEQSTWF